MKNKKEFIQFLSCEIGIRSYFRCLGTATAFCPRNQHENPEGTPSCWCPVWSRSAPQEKPWNFCGGGGSRRRENSAHLKNARCPWESLLSFLFPIYFFFFRYFCIIKVCVWFFFFYSLQHVFLLFCFIWLPSVGGWGRE